MFKWIFGAIISAFIGLCFLLYFANSAMNTPFSKEESQPVVFEVKAGDGFKQIIHSLNEQKLIKNEILVFYYARLNGEAKKMKMGEYEIKASMSPQQILSILKSGKSIERSFTVSEGLNIFEISQLFQDKAFGQKEEFLRLVKDPTFINELLGTPRISLEGYLYPETYKLTKYTDAKALITQMVENYKKVWEEIKVDAQLDSQPEATLLNDYELLTLASIVEKETGAPEERPLIASVFYNRIQKKMKLQTDPTIIYGIADETGALPGNIHKEDIHRYTRYNTYVIDGLPPGPISNPGREALKAVFHSTPSNFLYFVSKNDGRHSFSESYSDHENAVQTLQKNPKAREGKSWRQLNKNKSKKTKK